MTYAVLGGDPRLQPHPDDFAELRDEGRPLVGQAGGGVSNLLLVLVFLLAAAVLFLILNGQRLERQRAMAAAQTVNQPAPAVVETIAVQPDPAPAPVTATFTATPAPVVTSAPITPVIQTDPLQRLRAPAVVVDLQSAPAAANASSPTTTSQAQSAALQAPLTSGAGPDTLAGAFDRLSTASALTAPATSQAGALRNLGALVTQGSIIPAVMETALNSDLPGFSRAVVSRDVRSADGRTVLIPRGSRLIGEYRSALSLGQSRVFVIWTRVIRPDGVSVQIASPGIDTLGRGGLEGEVDNHFFTRFGGSILLSVLNAGVAAIGRTAATQITIGSPAAAAGAAASVNGEAIGPTVTIQQGEAINIFVARDLDFSGVVAP